MTRPSRNKHRSFLPWLAALLVLFAVLSLFLPSRPKAAAGLERHAESGEILYEVPRHITLSALAADLDAKGLIPSRHLFIAFLRATLQDKKIKAGFYYVRPSNSVWRMAQILVRGKAATKTVTIPEGKTGWEIYAILKGSFPFDSLRFDSLYHSPDFARRCRVPAPGLEGFVYPDTYVLPFRIDEEDALLALTGRFHQVIASFDTSRGTVKELGLRGWLTLASIVEKEAAVAQEQGLIAGVFHNRVRQGWSLGADPTVRFALRKLTGPLYTADLEVNSPYNTRRFAGLPPGPICSPGKGALMAALHPPATEMMYFVAKDDGSREHFFAVDYPQHLRYKALAAANRKRLGRPAL